MASSGGHALFPDASAYQTSKFALCRFTEFLDEGYAHLGLVAFALHPGATVTEMGLKLPEELHDYLTDTIELPADTLVWLCKERREWLRGRFVAATWNMEEFEKRKDEIVERDLLKFRMLF
jgi:NAD(P)-dependent dehydrogenase (short-subunit alcohol dehydrogenase family)